MSHTQPALTRRTALKAALGAAGAAALFSGPARAAARAPGAGLRTRFAVNIEIWWGGLPVLERMRKTAAAGFPAIEFWGTGGKDLPAMAALAKELGLEIAQFTGWGFEPGMNDPRNHELLIETIEQNCSIAKQLDCTRMTVVAGNDQPGMTQEQMHGHVIEGLKKVAPIAEKHGVTLILEPMNVRVDHKGHCLYGSAPAVAICRAVGSAHVKINWDLYHCQISEGDLCGRLAEGFDQLGYVQVADHPGRHEPGTGEIQYRRVLQQLRDLGYRGPVGLECWPEDGEERAIERLVALEN